MTATRRQLSGARPRATVRAATSHASLRAGERDRLGRQRQIGSGMPRQRAASSTSSQRQSDHARSPSPAPTRRSVPSALDRAHARRLSRAARRSRRRGSPRRSACGSAPPTATRAARPAAAPHAPAVKTRCGAASGGYGGIRRPRSSAGFAEMSSPRDRRCQSRAPTRRRAAAELQRLRGASRARASGIPSPSLLCRSPPGERRTATSRGRDPMPRRRRCEDHAHRAALSGPAAGDLPTSAARWWSDGRRWNRVARRAGRGSARPVTPRRQPVAAPTTGLNPLSRAHATPGLDDVATRA